MNVEFPIANIAYNGGAREIFNAGEYPTVKSTIEPLLIPLSHVAGHFPGHWGQLDQVWHYQYTSSLNDTKFYVSCFCIRFQQCSCDKQYNKVYFNNLPAKVAIQEKFDNYTKVYVNGTEPRVYDLGDDDKSKAVKFSSGFVLNFIVLSIFVFLLMNL